jgi:peptide/nickel transport system ATP-binding protein
MSTLLDLQLTAGYRGQAPVLRDVCLKIDAGEILALVGLSGSGKSSLALALLRLLEFRNGWAQGRILFDGVDLMQLPQRRMRQYRGRRIALVLQSPTSSLNPSMRLSAQVKEAWLAHQPGQPAQWRAEAAIAFELAQLPSGDDFLNRYPSQISVGQAQRVLIAMAVLHRPSLLIADEPTSALDVITQAGILRLFADLNRRLGAAILFISHDLLSVASLAHRVAILDRGESVETGSTERIFHQPQHAFTRQLIASLPSISRPGSLPSLAHALRQADRAAEPVSPAPAGMESG